MQDAVDFCRDNGLIFDAVNDNLPEIVEQYGSNSRKITCDIYIDDKAYNVDTIDFSGEVDYARIESALLSYADKVAMAV